MVSVLKVILAGMALGAGLGFGCAPNGPTGSTLSERRGVAVARVSMDEAARMALDSEPGWGGRLVTGRLAGARDNWRYQFEAVFGEGEAQRRRAIHVQTEWPGVCFYSDVGGTGVASGACAVELAAAVRIAQQELEGGRAVDVRVRETESGSVWEVVCVAGETLKSVTVSGSDGAVLSVVDEPESAWRKSAATWVRARPRQGGG